MPQTTRIAVITDPHYTTGKIRPQRHGNIADIFLQRAISQLNRFIQPDVTLILGDVLDDGNAATAPLERTHLRQIFDQLQSPLLIIPGNHDGQTNVFYHDFIKPPDIVDIHGVRFLPFNDEDRPNYCAERSETDIERFRLARTDFTGPIVSLQHVSLFPPDALDVPYVYTNADKVIRAMKKSGVILSISGHYHPGTENITVDGITYITVPSICEHPFPFVVITIHEREITSEIHHLALPDKIFVTDWHIHTELAYCAQDISFKRTVELSKVLGIPSIGISEHSGQLYFNSEQYWSGQCLHAGIASATADNNRTNDYYELTASARDQRVLIGFEVDCDYGGHPLLRPADQAQSDFLIGAIHRTRNIDNPNAPIRRIYDEYLSTLETFLTSGINILAHPFRLFLRYKHDIPKSLFKPTVKLLKQAGVAAEINFNHNEPSIAFFQMCVDAGVKLTFGSDAHRLCDIGEFTPHFNLITHLEFDGDLSDILLNKADLASVKTR
ncbi:MAG: metallophosphoesterase [Lentisphaerae bacterium]|nr:metallophosphoesterase [Lentisphaerota bacterium]